MDVYLESDTLAVTGRRYHYGLVRVGNAYIESPIFDALAAEYFASDA